MRDDEDVVIMTDGGGAISAQPFGASGVRIILTNVGNFPAPYSRDVTLNLHDNIAVLQFLDMVMKAHCRAVDLHNQVNL